MYNFYANAHTAVLLNKENKKFCSSSIVMTSMNDAKVMLCFRFGCIYLLNGISTPYGLFNSEI